MNKRSDALWMIWLVCLVPMTAMVACTAVQKQHARTVVDVARIACELFAEQEAKRLGVSPADIARTACATEELLQPWIDQILAANRMASNRLGVAACPDKASQAKWR